MVSVRACIRRPDTYKLLMSVQTCLYFAFVYLKLRCLGFLCALSASSVYPELWRVSWSTRWHRWMGCPRFLFFLTLKATDKGEMSKAVTCHISFQHSTVSCRESLSGSDSPLVHNVFTLQRPLSWFRELRFPACVCIAVRRAELTLMMSSHSCAIICVCVQSFFAVSSFDAIGTKVKISNI